MVLTFRSSAPETKTIIERDGTGRQRVAVATRDDNATRQWDLRVEHPSGQKYSGTYSGHDVVGALGELLSRSENDYRDDKARGDRPPSQPYDHNRSINEANAPIIPIPNRR